MRAEMIPVTPEEIRAQMAAAVEQHRATFTEEQIRARAVLGVLCDCERDVWYALEQGDFLLGEGC